MLGEKRQILELLSRITWHLGNGIRLCTRRLNGIGSWLLRVNEFEKWRTRGINVTNRYYSVTGIRQLGRHI